MQSVQSQRPTDAPPAFDMSTFPPDTLELICQFLAAEDVTRLSMVNCTSREILLARIQPIFVPKIEKALSEGRAQDASRMIGSLSKWLASTTFHSSIDEDMRVWGSLQDFAQHASLNQCERALALRQIFYYSCQKMEGLVDSKLVFLLNLRDAWFRTVFPVGSPLFHVLPCKSFNLVSDHINGLGIPDLEAKLGASIEAIRLHDNPAECAKSFSIIAQTLTDAYEHMALNSRAMLGSDLILCLKDFPTKQALDLMQQLDGLKERASAEDRRQFDNAWNTVLNRLHHREFPDQCSVM